MVRPIGRARLRRTFRLALLFVAPLLALYGVVSGIGQAASTSPKGARSASASAPRPQYLVLIVLDGARPEYLHMANLPHVAALRAAGTEYIRAIDGILESETPAGHTALATGSTPRRNGILGFEWAQNDNDYSLFSPQKVSSGAMERIMATAKVPTIAGLYKSRYPAAKVVALSGHKYYAADPLGGPQADAIMYYQGDSRGRYVPVAIPGHAPPPKVLQDKHLIMKSTSLPAGQDDHAATLLALSAFRHMHQRITLINYPEFDWPLGHVYGGEEAPGKVAALMQAFDRDLGMIEDAYRKAGVLDKTLFVITADHGMASLGRFVSQDIVTRAIAAAHTTAPAISWSNAAYIWLHDERKASTVARAILASRDPGIQSVYYVSKKGKTVSYRRAGGWYATKRVDTAEQYLLKTLINGHQPSVVVLCRNHATFAPTSTHWKADHGGASWQSQHIPLILAGPGIRSHTVTNRPALLIDIAPTVLADMGVSPARMEGHVLADALTHPTSAFSRARAREIHDVGPVAEALLAQEHYEVSHRW